MQERTVSMTQPPQKATLVISLDFELYWGLRDIVTLGDYRTNLLGERSVIPALLKLFDEYRIHATWAIVGMMFFETREDLIRALPSKTPNYADQNLSPYPHIQNIGRDEQEDPFHYAPSLIKLIASSSDQEIGSHTFSHYYCLEKGHSVEAFRADLEAAMKATSRYNINVETIVFPRNQVNDETLSICNEFGITAYRGNESSWIYQARSRKAEALFRRGLRLLDAYINLTGHNCYSPEDLQSKLPLNIPSSRFLRPFSKRFQIFEPLRLRRILSNITHAAKNGLIYHLWWHPHNFGADIQENLLFLRRILDHYTSMKQTYGMESLNMGELARRLMNGQRSFNIGAPLSYDMSDLQKTVHLF